MAVVSQAYIATLTSMRDAAQYQIWTSQQDLESITATLNGARQQVTDINAILALISSQDGNNTDS